MQRVMKIAAVALALTPALILTVINGCSPSTEIGGVRVINALPDTWITGTPPVLDQTEILVEFNWTGEDTDGEVKGYQWKLSSNGPDGISVMDTLTVDPVSGDTLNPWHFTTAKDTVFIVSADSANYQPDAFLPEEDRRFFQPHTLFLRAVDDDGGVDPTPAMITFTATTLAPTIRLISPVSMTRGYQVAERVPRNFILGWGGSDPDFEETEKPVSVRWILKDAVLPMGPGEEDDVWITGEYHFNRNKDELITFSEPGWSDWIPYEAEAEDRTEVLNLEEETPGGNTRYYLFALQARDIAGAVSLDLSYARTVHNFRVDNLARPLLTIRETYLGDDDFIGDGSADPQPIDIAMNQPLEFRWAADASPYGGTITGYRWGWDVQDLEDDEDPGWVHQFGLGEENRTTGIYAFGSGLHTLTVECIDNSNQLTRGTIRLTVVPVPEPSDQDPLLLIDDVNDHLSQGWYGVNDGVPYNQDPYRDSFWESTLGAVSGWSSSLDVLDTETDANWGYRDVVNYRVLLWTNGRGQNNYISSNFNPSGRTAFIWLESYLANVGNLFLAGSGAMQSFHYNDPFGIAWLYPIIYDSDAGYHECGNLTVAQSFGTGTDDDGNTVILGRERFPYRSAGISTVSLMVPPNFWVDSTNCGHRGQTAKRRCLGTKGVILDQEFKQKYAVNSAFPDTVLTWSVIDDEYEDGVIPIVNSNYLFGENDEFYDQNVTSLTTGWFPQLLEDGSPAVEVMWRAYPRYDWIADLHLADGNSDFPHPSQHGNMGVICGSWSINPFTGRTYLDGVPLGIYSHKLALGKPNGRADVYWGFDPHRMEHTAMEQAVRWVLEEHFELEVN